MLLSFPIITAAQQLEAANGKNLTEVVNGAQAKNADAANNTIAHQSSSSEEYATLFGSWEGIRPVAHQEGIRIESALAIDVLHGVDNHCVSTTQCYNFEFRTSFDCETLLGWHGASFLIDVLGNGGSMLNAHLPTAQGTDNIETTFGWRIYQWHLEQQFFNNGLSLLVGTFDVNSEFYNLQSSGMFINPSFGIGAEFSQTGQNGPSIFPVTSLGLRAAYSITDKITIRSAVLDGVPGDPINTNSSAITWNKKDGILNVTELSFQPSKDADGANEKIAIGIWFYTTPFASIESDGQDLTTPMNSNNVGFYIVGEHDIIRSADHQLTIFGKGGHANPQCNTIEWNYMLGLHFTGIFSKDDAAGLAFSNVINGNPFLNSMQQQGVEIFASESIIECTYQYAVITGLILQPDIQLFINPNTEPTRPTMLVTGMRFIATL